MKTVFVINPKAGAEKDIQALERNILDTAKYLKAEAECYTTKAAGDACRFVSEYCKNNGSARFIACGGDGTFNEVLNGAIGFDGAEVGVIPMGTGNDFCRNFKGSADFLSVAAQLLGSTKKCDAIRYKVFSGKHEATGFGANMFNIGFDCNVADLTSRMKEKPFVSGSLAYFLSILIMLVKKKGANIKVELDGRVKYEGRLLLTAVANGSYCGGGVKSNPLAELNDGLLDVNIIYNISRLNFLSKLPFYMKGTHIKLKGIERVIANMKCKKAVITPLDGEMRLCVDGEIITVGRCEMEAVHNAFNFVVPESE